MRTTLGRLRSFLSEERVIAESARHRATPHTRETIETFIDDYTMEMVSMGCSVTQEPTWSEGDAKMHMILRLPDDTRRDAMTTSFFAKRLKEEMDKVGIRATCTMGRNPNVRSKNVHVSFLYDTSSDPSGLCINVILYVSAA